MSQFSSEAQMQKEFILQIKKFFPEYEIYNRRSVPILINGKKKIKKSDILLKNKKNENKLLIIELKKGKVKLGALGQIYLYFIGLKKEFQDKEISIVVVSGDNSPDTSDINKLKLAMLAKGREMKYMKKNESKFKVQIEKEYPEYKLEKEEKFANKKVLLLKHKSKSELLVVCETEGYKGFGQISYLLGREIKKAEYEKISGVVVIINGKKHEEELKLAMDKNENTIANIDVEFMTWHKNKEQLKST